MCLIGKPISFDNAFNLLRSNSIRVGIAVLTLEELLGTQIDAIHIIFSVGIFFGMVATLLVIFIPKFLSEYFAAVSCLLPGFFFQSTRAHSSECAFWLWLGC